MSVGNESRQTFGHYALATADNLAATGDDRIWDVTQPITVLRVGAVISTATVSSAGIVGAFDRRITTGSDTGRVAGLNAGADGVLNIPTATAAGKVVYKDLAVDLVPGDQIVAEVTTAAAGGGAAGGAQYFVEWVARHEVAGNLSDMVASS